MGRKKLLRSSIVLSAIERCFLERGQAPTIAELQRALGVGSTRTVLRYLKELEAAGAIERWPGARGLRLLRRAALQTATVSVPFVGEAPAGPLMIAEENIEGWLRIPATMARPPGGTFFLLRVRGDSMNRARVAGELIENGDLILVRQQPTADSGEIVVALIDGEATIKRLQQHPSYGVLLPDSTNPTHHPIMVSREFLVQGKVVGVIKQGTRVFNDQPHYA